MPLIPASLSSLNEKVESARKGFNSSLDKAGEKSGYFKAPGGSKSSSASSLGPLGPISSSGRPTPSTSTRPFDHPPPPPTRHNLGNPPPPPTRHNLGNPPPPVVSSRPPANPPPPPTRNKFSVPPPPPRRNESIQSAPSYQTEQEHYGPPPPLSKKPILRETSPYRPPPTNANGYGPPGNFPVQPSSRYGPPSPPRSVSPNEHQSSSSNPVRSRWAEHQPPAVSRPASTLPQPFSGKKHGQIPFPPFSQFTEKDKKAFFEMLDEFFMRKLSIKESQEKNNSFPPYISQNTKPSISNTLNEVGSEACRAELVGRYFKNYRQWTSQSDLWYTSTNPLPPPLQGGQDVKRMHSWSQLGNDRTMVHYILFPDLSQVWTQVSFDVSRPFPPRTAAAKYRPPPGQFDSQTLIESSEIYGPQMVAFAEHAERSGCHVARGECWDLANEALKAFPASHFQVPAPLASISRTHGILLYYGRSTGLGSGEGSWKQENDFGNIRAGDMIEWRLVACDTVNPTLTFTLGDPDHTAVIVDATGCSISNNRSGQNCPPSQLGYITVIEQSLKQIPIKRTYNLSTMTKGEVWIYRPMAEVTLLGLGSNDCSFPPPPPHFDP